MYAHRISFELSKGKILRKLLVLHKCDNRKCVNPSHLFIGTQMDNMRDKIDKGNLAWGEKSKRSNLKKIDILKIRILYATSSSTLEQLGIRFGVHSTTIWKIIKNKIWKYT